MDFLRHLLLVLHILGLAVVIGPFLFQVSRKAGFETRLMLTGLIVQLVTGLALIGVRQADDLEVDNAKMSVKLVVALLALGTVLVAARRQRDADEGSAPANAALPWFHTTGALAIVNVVVAVMWT